MITRMRKMTQEEFNALERDNNGYLTIPNDTDCTEICFGVKDMITFGDNCKLGDWSALGSDCKLGNYCTLGNRCELGNGCILGYECRLGDYCKLGNWCELGKWCALGNCCKLGANCKLGEWCVLGNDCMLSDYCNLSDKCVLGHWCKLGNCCTLGNGCKLGNGCELGEWCKLGDRINARATFEGKRVQDGLQMKISNTLNRYQTVYFYIDKYGVMFIQVGNWFGYLNDFKAYIEDINSNATYEEQYAAMCDYAKAVLPLMLKKSDAKRKEQQHEN